MSTTTGDTMSQTDEGAGREVGPGGAPRYTRRLSDKILIAFHHACDQADFEVAEQLASMLPIRCRAEQVWVMEGDGQTWSVRHKVSLPE